VAEELLMGAKMALTCMQDAVIDVDEGKVVSKSRGCMITERNEWAGFY
jgi:hypothetical protein